MILAVIFLHFLHCDHILRVLHDTNNRLIPSCVLTYITRVLICNMSANRAICQIPLRIDKRLSKINTVSSFIPRTKARRTAVFGPIPGNFIKLSISFDIGSGYCMFIYPLE